MKHAKTFVNLGRFLSLLSFIAFMLTWVTGLTGGTILGRTEEHLFNDAIVLALLSIVCLLDGYIHSKNL